jgi:hypothetical protein
MRSLSLEFCMLYVAATLDTAGLTSILVAR